MSHHGSEPCRCVSDHRPPYLELAEHHLHPIHLGGQKDETVFICNTTHSSVHELLRLVLKAGWPLSYAGCQTVEDRPVARYAHALAVEGYRRWAGSQA